MGRFGTKNGSKMGQNCVFFKNYLGPFMMLKQVVLAHFEPVATGFGSWKIPKCLENGPFWDQKWVKNGSKMRFSKSDPGPFGMLKQVFLAHFEPAAWTARTTTTAEGPQRREDEAKQRLRDQTPRTGSSGVGQAAGTVAPRNGASRDQRRCTPAGLEHPGRNKQQAPPGATEAATRTGPWRCSVAEWGTRPGRSGENTMRTRPR